MTFYDLVAKKIAVKCFFNLISADGRTAVFYLSF